METQTKTTAKDFFINLGAIVALYAIVVNLVNLLFRVINNAYPQINSGYGFFGSQSISWPVASLIIFFPIFTLLMWLLEKDYKVNPEKQNSGVHRWLTYITLFISGLAIAIDLVTVLYYFLDGQELATGFLLKVLALLVIAGAVFSYYLYDVLGKLTAKKRNMYRIISFVIIIASIAWGFAVLGSPRTQRLLKYDEEKTSDLESIAESVRGYFYDRGVLPNTLLDLSDYYYTTNDSQTGNPYEYKKTSATTYELCAIFNKPSTDEKFDPSSTHYPNPTYGTIWITHPEGYYCFKGMVNPEDIHQDMPVKVMPVPLLR